MPPLDLSCRIIILIDILTSNVILSLINFLARDIWKMLEIPLKSFRFLCFKRSHYRIALSWFCPDLMERLSTTAPTKLKNLTKCIRAFSPHGHLPTVSMLSGDLFSRPVLLETQLLEKPFRAVCLAIWRQADLSAVCRFIFLQPGKKKLCGAVPALPLWTSLVVNCTEPFHYFFV